MGFLGLIIAGAIAISAPLLQAIGVFTRDWVRETSCEVLDYKPSCCNASVELSSENCIIPFGLSDLHGGVYVMQLLAFLILFTPAGCGLIDLCCCSDNEEASGSFAAIGGCCFMLYPLAGILNFIGCMIFVGEYSAHSFGKSFDFCLGAGFYVLILTGISIFLMYLKHKRKSRAGNQGTVDNTVTAAPYGPVTHTVQTESTQVTQVQDPETGVFIRLVSKVNVYRQLRYWS